MCASDCQLINCCAVGQLGPLSRNIVLVGIDIIHTQTHTHTSIHARLTIATAAYEPNQIESQLNKA